jgi:tetratricopeptide (TPR) repeat protein
MKPTDPNTAFQLAEKAIMRGDWLAARRAYGRVLRSLPADWRGYYRVGLLEAGGGYFELAERAFKKALALSEDNIQVAANLAQVFLLTDRPNETVALMNSIAVKAPNSPDVQRLIGTAHQELGRLDLAEEAYRRAMELGTSDPAVLNNRAVVLQALGRSAEAIELLELLRSRGDDKLETLNNLGNLYRVVGRNSKSAETFALALEHAPLSTHLHRNLALLNRDGGHIDAGIASARRASISNPQDVDGLVVMAEMLEHRAELGHAGRLTDRALMGAPGNMDALALMARVHRRNGDSEAALHLLQDALLALAGRPGEHKMFFEIAQVEQALGHYHEAFQALVQANQSQMSWMPEGRVDPLRAFDQVLALNDMLSIFEVNEFSINNPVDPEGAPVFLVGFPRSGTTLLDQVLDSHPSIVVLEERPLVAGMIARIKNAGYRYPEDLCRLDNEILESLRVGYLNDRDSYISVPESCVFVDKMPLNIVHAALIRRVFPNARFILSLRDPCDVCLSCFMQSFELNDWMAVFTDIEATARLYDGVFSLWRGTVEKLRIDHHVVRYEDLIADLRSTASATMAYLGLEWDDRMAAFHEHAKRRGHLATPSHSQVTQPVYGHAVGRWRRYGAAMDDVADRLKPSRQAMGYGD